jgi:predicted nucleic acid-binding protein
MEEPATRRLQAVVAKDPAMIVWWACEIECVSAIARAEREGLLDTKTITSALRRLAQLASAWHEVDPSDVVRETAARFLRIHPLRAADALQLAAAFLAADRRPASLELVTFDERLGVAARREGFAVIDAAAVTER